MSALKAGDLFIVLGVFCPCGHARGYVGQIFTVKELVSREEGWCGGCAKLYTKTQGVQAEVDYMGDSYFALSVVKKIEPLTEEENGTISTDTRLNTPSYV